MTTDLAILENNLGYPFKNKKLLTQALTHRSVKAEHNERLEFLGDSILNCVIANMLYQKDPHAKEGDLSRFRSMLVCEDTLASLALEFKLSDYLILGAGELRAGGFRRKSILADAVEAIIAAIYLDADFLVVQKIIETWFAERVTDVSSLKIRKDPKSRLQEYLQSKKFSLPTYNVIDITGADHDQTFIIECSVPGFTEIVRGQGNSRRIAEQEAATKFLHEVLKQE